MKSEEKKNGDTSSGKVAYTSYKSSPKTENLPKVESAWQDYGSSDALSFLKPLVKNIQNLMNDEGIDKEKLAAHLDEWHEQEFKWLRLKLPFFHNWLRFHAARLRNFKQERKDFENLHGWLRTCFNTTDKETTHFFVFFELSRDEEMRQIVFDEEGSIREFFRETQSPGHVYLETVATKFLARYDLEAAFSIIGTLTESKISRPSKIGENACRRIPVRIPFWISLIAILFLFLSTIGSPLIYHELNRELANTFGQVLFSHTQRNIDSKIQVWSLLPYLMISASFPFFLVWLVRLLRKGRIRKSLPRLFGGILVGYVPLMSSGDVWKWMLTLPIAPAVGMGVLALLFSYLYLYIESRNAVSDCAISDSVKSDIAIRSGQVFFIGLAQACAIGLVVSELFGFAALKGLYQPDWAARPPIYVIQGAVGLLVPRAVLLYAPLALFLGILIQLIWEDKTATQPL